MAQRKPELREKNMKRDKETWTRDISKKLHGDRVYLSIWPRLPS